MRRKPRKRLIVDRRLQAALILRVAAYWFFSLVAVGLILLAWDIAQGLSGPFFNPSGSYQLWYTYVSVALASLLFLPVLLADTVTISNRFAGPVYRVRNEMRSLTAGQPVAPVRFRKKDDWTGLAEDFNALVAYVERLKLERDGGRSDAELEAKREPIAATTCPRDGRPATPVDTTFPRAYADNSQGFS